MGTHDEHEHVEAMFKEGVKDMITQPKMEFADMVEEAKKMGYV